MLLQSSVVECRERTVETLLQTPAPAGTSLALLVPTGGVGRLGVTAPSPYCFIYVVAKLCQAAGVVRLFSVIGPAHPSSLHYDFVPCAVIL